MLPGVASRVDKPARVSCGHTRVVPSLLLVVVIAVATVLGWWWLAGTLAEPDNDDPGDPKVPYRDLATWAHASVVLGVSTIAAVVLVVFAAPVTWPVWVVLSTFGVVLAGIDGFTTWIPRVVSWASWAALAVAIIVMFVWGGPWWGAVAGGTVAGILFAAMWLFTRGGIGFGDVRYIPLVGAAAMSSGMAVFVATMLVGSLLVAAHSVLVKMVRRGPGLVPWAPGYLAGALVALVWQA